MKRELPDELKFLTNRNLPQKPFAKSMNGKICVITGATSGVGLETARALASHGAQLVLVSRSQEKADRIARELRSMWNIEVDSILADFSDLDQVRQAANTLLERYPRIDVLINCAGMHSTRKTHTPAGFETVFCVNHLASFLLTALLLDRMIASSPSRIIQVNSEGHRFNGLDLGDLSWQKRHYTGLRSYGASKTAQLLTVWEFADLLQDTGVTINAVHPGDVKTNIGNNNGWLYRIFTHYVTGLFLKDAVISGPALGYLASAPELAAVSGQFFHLTHEEKPAPHALDREMGQRVWVTSLQLTGLPADFGKDLRG
ncbi:MAG: SDR family oxidoreductase [Clostridia bacterium]|nr:SDR family oxidoreductase [Clostridia bacterium]NCC76248.1 SDR family oxidoreductase [Clostridia bacterium]